MNPYEDIYRSYEAEVLALLPYLEEWWDEIGGIERGPTSRQQRWPLGLSGHPRYIAIFRRYALKIMALNARLADERNAGDTIPDEPWGTEEEPGEEVETALPRQVLRDDFIQAHPDLRDHFRLFMFMPIGAQDHVDVTEGRIA